MITEDYLEPITEEKTLDRVARIQYDPIDREVRQAHYREKNGYKATIWGLSAANVVLGVSLAVLSQRPPQRIFYNVGPLGDVSAASGQATVFKPTPSMARYFLQQWVQDRYNRERRTIAAQFPDNYLFLSKTFKGDVEDQDRKDDVIANVLSGKIPENTVDVATPQIISFDKHQINGKEYWGGYAIVDFRKTFARGENGRPRIENWRLPIEFLFNEAQVADQTAQNPRYELVNPVGITIMKKPIENRLPDVKE